VADTTQYLIVMGLDDAHLHCSAASQPAVLCRQGFQDLLILEWSLEHQHKGPLLGFRECRL